ncbi:hypothetical protein [Nonomuraea sp. NPDC049480]|uniref:hypothetical protein n=1 Tax=Nonomuraea sp. NPDC049480 TaxID=3364353 RepID=UPI0037B46F6B
MTDADLHALVQGTGRNVLSVVAQATLLQVRPEGLDVMENVAQAPPADKVAVEINGMVIYVPPNALNVYLVQAHVNSVKPEEVSGAILTTDLMFAWTWLIEGLAEGGWGEVVAFDVALKTCPRWSQNLGRIDGPTTYLNRLRHTAVGSGPERWA